MQIFASLCFFVFLLTCWCVLTASGLRSFTRHRETADDAEGREATSRVGGRDLGALVIPRAHEQLRVGRADCTAEQRYCGNDDDCDTLCRTFVRVRFVCDSDSTSTCVPAFVKSRPGDNDGDGGDAAEGGRECDTRNGEYALLVGYTALGYARWQCVQLYSHWQERETFCEGGNFAMNADVREPSFRDCDCPEGTLRAVHAMANQYDHGLPHCVPKERWPFLRNDMRQV